jgi:hypothetical protein
VVNAEPVRNSELRKESETTPNVIVADLIITKTITNVTFRQDISGAARIIFYLFSELVDQNAEVFAFVTILRSPYRGEETIVRYGSAGTLHQVVQHLELLRSEVNLLSELFDTITRRIQHEITDSNERVRCNGGCFGGADGCSQPRG